MKTPEEKEIYTPDWEFVTGSFDSSFRMLSVPKDKYKEVTINLTPQVRKEGGKIIHGLNYPIATIVLHDDTSCSASKVFNDATLLANQIAKRWNGYNDFISQENQLKEALRELLESTEELATIVHMITRKQGDAINKAKLLLKDKEE